MSGAWHWLLMALTLRRGTSGRARDRQDGLVRPQKASRAGGTLGEYREEGSQSLKDSPIQGQHRAPEQGVILSKMLSENITPVHSCDVCGGFREMMAKMSSCSRDPEAHKDAISFLGPSGFALLISGFNSESQRPLGLEPQESMSPRPRPYTAGPSQGDHRPPRQAGTWMLQVPLAQQGDM
ncbi:unnamed protein product [Rangifer tarandus platyrhynchus]|uniref:Uncharacterized protein n=1 Tax=Rangifer tarandus platyrhynchus TaxID=3082113 RepID=A0AC59YB27_RANTA